jgi:hypothetical protein
LAESPTTAETLFTLFYIQNTHWPAAEPGSYQFVVPPPPTLLSEGGDTATNNAEILFRKAVDTLRELRKQKQVDDSDQPQLDEKDILFWPSVEPDTEQEEDW